MTRSEKRLQRRARRNPSDPAVWYELGQVLVEKGDGTRAMVAFAEAARLTKNPEQCFLIGQRVEQLGYKRHSKGIYEMALELEPSHRASALAISQILVGGHQFEEAWSVLVGQLSHHVHDREVRLALAHVLLCQNEPEQALEHARAVINVRPDDVDALQVSAACARKVGDHELELRIRRKIMSLRGVASFQELTDLGVALVRANRDTEAIEVFRRALATEPGRVEAHANLGAALMNAGELDEALRLLNQAIGIDPEDPHALCSLGTTYQRLGRVDDALVHFRAAASFSPGWVAPLFNAGVALAEVGRRDEAREVLEQALFIDPSDEGVLEALGDLVEDDALAATPGFAGDLDTFRVPDLLQLLRLRGLSGRLILEIPLGTGEIAIRDGSLVSATSPCTPRLGDILVEDGHVRSDQIDNLLRETSDDDSSLLGARMLALGWIDKRALRRALTKQISGALREMLDWTEGRFVFQRDERWSEVDAELEFDTEQMILDAARTFDESMR